LSCGGLAQATGVDFYSDWTIQNGDDYSNPPYDYIALHDSATVTMTGGRIAVCFDAYDTSAFNFQDGVVDSTLQFHGSSTVTMTNGTTHGSFNMYDDSELNINGGTLLLGNVIALYGSSTATMTGGALDVSGFNMYDNSILNISGGILNGTHISIGNSNILNLSGGNFGTGNETPWIYSKNIINIYGRDLSIVPYYTQTDSFVSGHWADDTAFGFILGRAQIYNPQIVFHEIPEPATMFLLLIGITGVRRFNLSNRKDSLLQQT